MTVLLCIAGLLRGGAEKQMLMLAKGLVKNGDHVVIHIFGGSRLVGFDDLASVSKDIHFSNVTSGHKISGTIKIICDLINLTRKYKPDIVYGSLFIAGAIIRAANVFGLLRTVVISSIRTDFVKRYKWYEKIAEYLLYYTGNGVICNGNQSFRGLKRPWRRKIFYIPNGVDPREHRLTMRKKHNKKHVHILNVGRLIIKFKNQLMLIDAIKLLKDKYPDFSFCCTLVGGDVRNTDDKEIIENRIRLLGLEDEIRLEGNVDDVYRYYYKCDVLIHNSIIEGFPNAVLEAMLAGMPIILSQYMGGLNIIENGVHGFIAEDNGARSLFKAIECFIMLPPKLRLEMGRRARKHVLLEFSNEKIVGKHRDLFEQLIKQDC